MGARENKQFMQDVYSELAKGVGAPFLERMADDVRWTNMGTTAWSGTYEGKETIRKQLLGPLMAKFARPYRVTAHRFIAEDDLVVVESRGDGLTKEGKAYNNVYCIVFRLEDGKVKEITEYLDTELVRTVLGDRT